MKKIKHIMPFVIVMFVAPIFTIIAIGCFQIDKSFIQSILTSIATSLIAAGVVYWFIDNRIKDLIETDDEITIVLKSPNREKIKCPPMSRKDFCRSEIMGYIGMVTGGPNFKMDRERFIIIGKQICDTQKTKGNQEFIVDCTDEEIDRFSAETKSGSKA